MAEKGLFTAWAKKQNLKKDIAASIKEANDLKSQSDSLSELEAKPKSPKRRGLLKGLLASAAALAVSSIPHGRITTVEQSMEQPDQVPDLASKKINLAAVEAPDSKGPISPEVRQQYLDMIKAVAKEQINLTPEFKAQLDAVDNSNPFLRFSSSDKKNFDEVGLELHSRGKTEESVLYTKITYDTDGTIKSIVIRNGLIEGVDKIKAEKGYSPSHVFGADDMRSRAVELAQKRLGKSQSSDWTLHHADPNKNINPSSREDQRWEIKRTIDQPGYAVSQTVRVGQIIIEAAKTGAPVAQK